ncbi:type 11 methyltransferase [Scytonema sp. HK-05]|uniref:class I SAM-dependent methyltransferase n=1 Tax=Scytonema sp. HK-05 TaxID=1137095 RepID=UPI0009377208|nr:class I SAM-dependent methyltransferase [Scytonema sp. HK-05]OKH48286.1 SAM-dependent methyltransferase [Scytonema sp. HK-05]BAY47745.1 type 11 methyltransferase [Scytonema sp. HK-05]
MTVNQPCVCANCGKRLFAWLMAQGDDVYDKFISDRKRSLFANLHGNVLEIDPGTGPNLPYYPKDINLIGIEPNPFMHSYLKKEAQKLGFNNIDLRTSTAEQIDAEDNSIDAVVSTLVLCSVPNLAATLQEVLRVLKPGGSFLFIEHVAAPQGTLLRQVQSTIRPIWKVLADGCHPDRETWIALENAGFKSVNYEHFKVPVPIVSPQIIGVAIR